MMNGYRLWCGRFRTLKPQLKARLMRLIPLTDEVIREAATSRL